MENIRIIVSSILFLNFLIGGAICVYRLLVDSKLKSDSLYEIWVNGGVWGKTGIIFLSLSFVTPFVLSIFAGGLVVTLVMAVAVGLVELVKLIIGFMVLKSKKHYKN